MKAKIYYGPAGISGPYLAQAEPQGGKRELGRQIERLEELDADQLAEALGLYGWGRWDRMRKESLGYSKPPHTFSAKGTWEPDLRRHIYPVSDEEGMRIDAAVSTLKSGERVVIETIYRDWVPWKRLPQELGVSTSTIRKYQHIALGKLDILLRGAWEDA